MQLVVTVVSNAKFHSSQDKTNQSTVTNVFQSINQNPEEVQVAADLAEEAEALAEEVAMAEEAALEEEAALTEDHEKCTRLHVEIVAKIVRFHSSQNKTSQSIAASVFKVIKETRK
jgi:F0F1-type ATP synthase epsilon subunit